MNGTTLTLVRHGRTPSHAGNRYTGSTDLQIDKQGRRDAERLAIWAAHAGRPDVLYASPMTRAVQTVRPVAEALNLRVHTDVRLRELDFGEAEGYTMDEMRRRDPSLAERFERDPITHHWPGGEHPANAAERGVAALRDITAAHPGLHVVIVCHSTLIRLVICRFLGVRLETYRTVLRGIDPVAGTQVTMQSNGAVMLDHYNRPPALAVEVAHADIH